MPASDQSIVATIVNAVSTAPEYRKRPTRIRHPLISVLTIGLLGVIAGAEGWTEIEDWAVLREEWLRKFIELPFGIPDETTLLRTFAAIDPAWLDGALRELAVQLGRGAALDHMAVDGKALRGSARKGRGNRALHIMHVWSVSGRRLIAQRAVDGKENELVAIREMIKCLDLEGVMVTIDAAGTQKDVASLIVERGGDYCLAVRANQPKLEEDIVAAMAPVLDADALPAGVTRDVSTETDHGRILERTVVVAPVALSATAAKWPAAKAIAYVRSRRIEADKASEEWRAYITSRNGITASQLGAFIRGHWSVENHCHWSLDVALREDACRVTHSRAAVNLSRMRILALEVLRAETTVRRGLAAKARRCAMSPAYMEKALAAFALQG